MAQRMFIKPNTKIKFFENHKPVMYGAFLLSLIGLVISFVIGPNWGTSFEGGTSISIHFEQPVPADQVRKIFVDDPRFESVSVQTIGRDDENKYIVRTRTTTSMSCDKLALVKTAFNDQLAQSTGDANLKLDDNTWPSCDGDGIRGDFDLAIKNANDENVTDLDPEKIKTAIVNAGFANVGVAFNEIRGQYTIKPQGVQADAVQLLNDTFGDKFDEYKGLDSVSTVGADVGEKFRNDAIVSILIALGMMLLYIAFRFDSRYAPAAVISLATTTLITFAIIVFFQIEFTLETVAALLSLVGYGINDTIVNFDRVRENLALSEKDTPLPAIVNKSVNDCISRTVITSITTLLAILPLILIANGTTRDFAVIMFCGICIATLNSMFISCPLLVKFDTWFKEQKKKQEAKKAIEDDIVAEA